MKYFIAIFLILLLAGGAWAWAKYGRFLRHYDNYPAMLEGLYDDTVPTISSKELQNLDKYYLLDTRELAEYKVSHIANAIPFGYDYPSWNAIKNMDKNATIVVYCSVGYRSEKIGEQLQAKGYTKVYNLYGGIFQWFNEGNQVVDTNNKPTDTLHGYNAEWAKWVTRGKVIY